MISFPFYLTIYLRFFNLSIIYYLSIYQSIFWNSERRSKRIHPLYFFVFVFLEEEKKKENPNRMATAAATSSSSSASNSRVRRKSRPHSRPNRAESELVDGSAPQPLPAVESSSSSPPPPPPSPPQPVIESVDRQEVVEADAAAVKEKKSAWNKPSSNGVIEVVSPVMGAATWPALSAGSTTKTSSNDPPPQAITITTTPDGSVSTPVGLRCLFYLLFSLFISLLLFCFVIFFSYAIGWIVDFFAGAGGYKSPTIQTDCHHSKF